MSFFFASLPFLFPLVFLFNLGLHKRIPQNTPKNGPLRMLT